MVLRSSFCLNMVFVTISSNSEHRASRSSPLEWGQPLPFYCVVVVVLSLAHISSGLTLAMIYISVVFIFLLSFVSLFFQRSLSAVSVAVDVEVFCLMGMILACALVHERKYACMYTYAAIV